MADCSNVGTTVDRATRAILGSTSSDTTKHVAAILGHAATVGTNTHNAAMPVVAPEYLTLPSSATDISSANNNAQAQRMVASPAHSLGLPPTQQFHPSVNQIQLLHHQQQQQAMAHAMFHHQQQIMHQQMQIASVQRQQQLQQQREQATLENPLSEETAKALEDHVEDDFDRWHEGLEDEITNIDFPGEEGLIGPDGNVRNGASIEELAQAWAEAEAEYERFADQEDHGLDTAQDAALRPYEFINKETEAPAEAVNWMEEGLRQFKQGNLREAIRAFEMELQHNNPDSALAWRMLGRCHAENDMDPEAIKCLEAAVDRDPFSPESLLALGVSYVNELNHERALENMKAWFTHNPKYAGMEFPADIYGAGNGAMSGSVESPFEEVKSMLLSALAFDASDAADIHEALGVIYNVNRDYDAAAKSFRKALESRPNDYQLWNKLGATLANGSASDQALPAYHRALQIKPKYARAWLNMAISHSNLQDHNEAARCYLQTLSLNSGATHCWTYLRMALSCAERWDLLPLVFSQDLDAFKEHFDFVHDQT